ncbi:hypothetical protein [Vreelandella lutescens]|uniref:Uncharacterized protein n=1 Tax=Vreelandella lutescens TaxID=1602943 RepID=A0ABQ1NU04_9GAMM|nr:hypothetical protein [Halomonas lutescens]GGC83983.1 hypothetical protein GCM10011382_12700 [Halomonas lutescens]
MDIIEARTLAQRAFQNGYIVVFDRKEGSMVASDDQCVRTDQAFSFCREVLFDHYADIPDDDPQGRSLRQIESEEELIQGFQEVSSEFMFFALGARFDNASLEEVLADCKERLFFPPWYIIYRGQLIFGTA